MGELVPYLPWKVDDQCLNKQEERDPLVVRDLPPRTLALHELAEVGVDYILANLEADVTVTLGDEWMALSPVKRCWVVLEGDMWC